MANAKIDQNYQGVSLATGDDATAETLPLLVDPVLGYLEIDLAIIGTHTGVDASAKIDQNYEGVAMGYDDTNDKAMPLKVVASNNRLLLDLTI